MGYQELIRQKVAEDIRRQRNEVGTKPVAKSRVVILVAEDKDSFHIEYSNAGTMGKNELDISRAELDASLEIPGQATIYIAPAPQKEVPLQIPQSVAA